MKAFFVFVSTCLSLAALGQGFDTLKLSVVPEKTQIVPGEPLVLKIVVNNPGTQAVKAHPDLSPGFGMLEVSVESPGGRFLRILGPGWGASEAKPRAADLAPGASISNDLVLFYHAAPAGRADLFPSQVIFDKPGKYRIQAVWRQLGFKERIVAPDISVEVVPAQGIDLRVSEALVSETKLASFLAGAGVADPAQIAKAERIVAENEGSILSKHLSLALGRYFLRKSEPARAIAPLLTASSAPAKSHLRGTAILALAEAYGRSGSFDKAKALLDGAVAEFEESSQKARFERFRQELGKRAGNAG